MNPWNGTSFHNDVIYATYQEMVDKLGEPKYEGSADDKVQKEWQFITEDDYAFTIYDWKYYDEDVTDGQKICWHIGHSGGIASITEALAEKGLTVVTKSYDFLNIFK